MRMRMRGAHSQWWKVTTSVRERGSLSLSPSQPLNTSQGRLNVHLLIVISLSRVRIIHLVSIPQRKLTTERILQHGRGGRVRLPTLERMVAEAREHSCVLNLRRYHLDEETESGPIYNAEEGPFHVQGIQGLQVHCSKPDTYANPSQSLRSSVCSDPHCTKPDTSVNAEQELRSSVCSDTHCPKPDTSVNPSQEWRSSV